MSGRLGAARGRGVSLGSQLDRSTLVCACRCGAYVKATGPKDILDVFGADFAKRHKSKRKCHATVMVDGEERVYG